MANQNTAYGLRPIGLVGSASNSTGVTQYEIASNNTNAIFQYSLCVPLAAGVIDQAGATNGGTTQALGVLMGVEYVDSVSKKPIFINYWPGSGSVSADTNHPVKAFVADNPNQLFKVASDATLTDRATAQAAVFANASLGTSARTGSTENGSSNSALGVSTINTTATLPLRPMSAIRTPTRSRMTRTVTTPPAVRIPVPPRSVTTPIPTKTATASPTTTIRV